MRILVVEDEKKIATFVQRGLKEFGFVVDVVHRGDEAFEIILDQHFDAVVLDVMLPGRDGLSILRILRERANSIPVVADAGALVLSRKKVELSAMCQDLVEDAQVLGMRCKIRAVADITRGIIVRADQSYIRQALLNLLDNAIKYNGESGAISIALKKSGSLALFRIANTGPEIPKDRETRIFERFYRADPSHTFDVVGSGLGLSICREIALAHGGNIWLERQEPGWTAFVLALPCPDETVGGKNILNIEASSLETTKALG